MKHLKSLAVLAFAILAACAKEEINIPDNPPPPPPPPPPPDSAQVWADTAYKTPVESGTVSPPCIYVSTSDILTGEYLVYKYNLEGTKREQVIGSTSSSLSTVTPPGFSQRGEFMAFGDREGLQMQDMRTDLTSLICNIPGKEVGNVQFSPDDSKLAFNAVFSNDPVFGFGDLYVVDARPGATPVDLTKSNGVEILSVPSFGPDGKQIAYTRGGVLYVTDLEGAQKIAIQKDNSYWTADPIYSRNGRELIFTSGTGWLMEGGDIYAAAVAEGAAEQRVQLTESREYGLKRVYMPMLGPDGTLYFLGETYTEFVHLYARSVNGGPFRMVAPCVSARGEDARLTFVER